MTGQGHYFQKCTFKANNVNYFVNFKQFSTQVCKITILAFRKTLLFENEYTGNALNKRLHHDIPIKKDKLLQKNKQLRLPLTLNNKCWQSYESEYVYHSFKR